MNIFKLSIRNILHQPLSSGLSILLLSLGVGIFSVVLHLQHSLEQQISRNTQVVDMVVGAKGSPLQLILSAVLHIDDPTGNIPLGELSLLQKNPMVRSAIPLSYGDSYQAYRIVGTDTAYLSLYQAQIAQGQVWQAPLEVVLGAEVAQKLSLKLGDTFSGNHGLVAGGYAHNDKPYQVVGILKPTQSVLDQLILTATESVWKVHEEEKHEEEGHEDGQPEEEAHEDGQHEEDGQEEEPHEAGSKEEEDHEKEGLAETPLNGQNVEEEREVTAILVKFSSPRGLLMLPSLINKKPSLQAALPSYEIIRLFRVLGFGIQTLQGVALAIALVSALSVFVSLYQALRNRLYELALMRVYGARPSQLFLLLLMEGCLLCTGGYLGGIILSRWGMWLLSLWPQEGFHYHLSQWHLLPEEGLALVLCLALGALASALPARKAHNLAISQTLRES